MSDDLLIVGASARAAAHSAIRAELIPMTADLFADQDLADRCQATQIRSYPWGLVDVFQSAPPRPWMYTGALENYPDLVDRLAATHALLGNAGPVLRRIRDPRKLASLLGRHGLPVAEIRMEAELVPVDGSWLRKPWASAGGNGVSVWEGKCPSNQLELGHRVYYQKRIEGQPCSGVFVAAKQHARLLGVTHQWIGSPWAGAKGYQYVGSVGPIDLDGHSITQFRRIGNLLSRHFELQGLFGVDAIVDRDSVWVVEVNPRYPASVEVLERTTDIRTIAMHVEACGHGTLPRESDARPTHSLGKAVLYAQGDINVPEAFVDVALRLARSTDGPLAADIPAAGTLIRRGRPVATVFATGDDNAAVYRGLQERLRDLDRLTETARHRPRTPST